jgi:hypothetical protein
MTNKKVRLPTLNSTLKGVDKQPFLGVTQGGSSRDRGARPAATNGQSRTPKPGDWNDEQR